jgi:hypothetical protein
MATNPNVRRVIVMRYALVLAVVAVGTAGMLWLKAAVGVAAAPPFNPVPGVHTPKVPRCVRCVKSPIAGAEKPAGYGGCVVAPCGTVTKPSPKNPPRGGGPGHPGPKPPTQPKASPEGKKPAPKVPVKK